MRNLFQSGTAFFIIAAISFVAAAISSAKYFLTDDGSAARTGGAVANGVVMLMLGMAVRKRNTTRATPSAPAMETRP
jgi:hypothetical protein